jgi:hypothetical protein
MVSPLARHHGRDPVKLKVTAPSGRVLDVESADPCPVIGVNSFVTFGSGAWTRDYQVGERGYHDAACKGLESAELIWRDYIAGNELVVSSNSRSVTVATLRCRHHELMGVFGGPTPPRDLIRSVFLDIDVVDDAAGMRISPAPGNPMSMTWEDVTIVVRNRGIIHVVGSENASAIVPNVAGTPVKFGEVWRRNVAGTGVHSVEIQDVRLILAQPYAAAEVSLKMFSDVPKEDLLCWIDNLRIAWS